MKKSVSVLLALCMLLSLLATTAFADSTPLAGDISGDGKVTPYDALQLQAFLHGELSLTSAQQAAAMAACPSISELSTAHIVAIFFKPLVGQSTIAPEADGLFHIRAAEDMALLHSFPYAGFSLDNDIDMAGKSWTPMIFNGYLSGNGNTVSNLTVSAAANNVSAGALFVKVGSANNPGATVCDLTLENAALTTTTAHKYAGIVCGTNYGRITEVTVANSAISGAINSSTKYAGAEVGMNYGTVSTSGSIGCDISYAATSQGVVGGNQSGASANIMGPARITRGGMVVCDYEIREPVPMNRQDVVDKMYAMSQVKWMVTQPSLFKESDFLFSISANKVYTGMPYSHATGTLEHIEAESVSITDGVHTLNNNYTLYIEGTTSASSFNVPGDALIPGHVMGHDCSSSVAAAWRTVSAKAGFERTTSLVPTDDHMAKFGLQRLGSYILPNSFYTSWDVNYDSNKQIPAADASERNYLYCSIVSNDDGSINAERLNDLYEGYAQCQPGDAIVYYCKGYMASDNVMRTAGHARLISGYPVVVRDGSGKIDPANSYLIITELGRTSPEKENPYNNNTYSTWYVDRQYSFKTLAGIENANPTQKHYAVYVPVTSVDYANAYREQTTFKLANSSSPISGVVSSNYGIIYTDVMIDGVSDRQFTGQYGYYVGNDGTSYAVYDGLTDSGTTSYKELRANATGSFTANRFLYKSVNLAKHAPQFAALAAGEHSYTIEVKITTGETKIYSGTFTTT